MKKVFLRIALTTIVVVFVSMTLFAEGKEFRYIGVDKCKMCHKSENRGDQYGTWLEGPHSKAFKVLATEKALKINKEKGIKSHPQETAECLVCHVTGYEAPASAKAESFSPEEGVGCEACHGPGSVYKSLKIMKALTAGEQDPKKVGFNKGDEATCRTCHNEKSPTFKPFDFDRDWAKISHAMKQ